MALATLNDLAYQYYQSVVTGVGNMFGAMNVSRAAVGVEATTGVGAGATSSINAPGSDTVVASLAALPAGTYEIEAQTFITGTTVAALESDNMAFKVGGTVIGKILTPVPGTTGAQGIGKYRCRVNILTPTTISVNSVAAATAASVYKATLVANKIGY